MSEAIANLEQQEHWNTVAGPKWVGLADVMESRMRAVNDLLLAAAAARSGETVLDVGCGTGTTTLPLAEAVGDTGVVLGVDISETMLATARERLNERRLSNVELLLADAQVHGFTPERFDLVASRFGVMFFADPVAAFSNIRQAMRYGGRLCFVCWAPLKDNPHWSVPFEIVQRYLGSGVPPPVHAPGPLAFSDDAYLGGILQAAGFAGIEIKSVSTEIEGSTPEQEAEFACIMGPPSRLIAERKPGEAALASIKQALTEAFAPFDTGSGVRLPASVFMVKARLY
jgi:SAM-dependent methyltransferase